MTPFKHSKTAIAALVLVVSTLELGASVTAFAQGNQCLAACQASYAQCYKDTGSNRKVCEAQLQQCLAGCINKR